MPVFTVAGDGMYDFWLLDGQPDFATIPSGVFDGLERDMPIRLQNGDQRFGMTHIRQRHNHWVLRQEPTGCAATLLHRKLSQSGKMHAERGSKYLIAMRLAPEAVVILKPIHAQGFLSVVTMYFRQGPIDGAEVGRYLGYEWATSPYRQWG